MSILSRAFGALRDFMRQAIFPQDNRLLFPTRSRIMTIGFMVAMGAFSFALIYAYLLPHPGISPMAHAALGMLGFLVILNARKAFIPGISPALFAGLVVWVLVGPFVAWNYLASGYAAFPMVLSAMLLVVYPSIVTWRSAIVGILPAWTLSALAFYLVHGYLVAPPMSHLVPLVCSFIGGIVLAISQGDLSVRQTMHAQNVLRATRRYLERPLAYQQAISQAMAHEAEYLDSCTHRQQLQSLSQELELHTTMARDDLENLMRVNLRSTYEQHSGQIRLVSVSHIMQLLVNELQQAFGFESAFLAQHLSLRIVSDYKLLAEPHECAHALALMFTEMLQPVPAPRAEGKRWQIYNLDILCHKNADKGLLEFRRELRPELAGEEQVSVWFSHTSEPPEFGNTVIVQVGNDHSKSQNTSYWPAYSMHVLHSLRAQIATTKVDDGKPISAEISFPLPLSGN